MKYYYDLHLHTTLSPCGNDDMTPNNIVNMSALLGLQIIAITDHNSMLNVQSCIDVCKRNGYDIIILPGMEVETAEELHVICLFTDIKSILPFAKIIDEKLNKIQNKEKIFGEQLVLDSFDEEISREQNLLITSTTLDIYQLVDTCKQYGGVAIPAHIDRNSYSIITNLGFIPDNLDISLVEFSRNANPEVFLQSMIKTSDKKYNYIVSSDTHYLEHMPDAQYYFEFEQKPTAYDVINYLKNL